MFLFWLFLVAQNFAGVRDSAVGAQCRKAVLCLLHHTVTDEVAQFDHARVSDGITGEVALFLPGQEPRVKEHGQVFGNVTLFEPGCVNQLRHGERPAHEGGDQTQAGRFAEQSKEPGGFVDLSDVERLGSFRLHITPSRYTKHLGSDQALVYQGCPCNPRDHGQQLLAHAREVQQLQKTEAKQSANENESQEHTTHGQPVRGRWPSHARRANQRTAIHPNTKPDGHESEARTEL